MPDRESILAMEAGSELDALVEKHIFERDWVLYEKVVINEQLWLRNTWMAPGIDYHNPPGGTHAGQCPPPRSSDIAAAMEVAENRSEKTRLCVIMEYSSDGERICAIGVHHRGQWIESNRATAATLPLAICRAALLTTLARDVTPTSTG